MTQDTVAVDAKTILAADIKEAGTCHICGKTEWTDRAGYGFRVNECRKCDRPLCEDCAESDYDMVDDPFRYVCTQYQCPNKCEPMVQAVEVTL